jgi:hypothetical protein
MKVKKGKCDDGGEVQGSWAWSNTEAASKEGMAVVKKLVEECSHKALSPPLVPRVKERCAQMPSAERMRSAQLPFPYQRETLICLAVFIVLRAAAFVNLGVLIPYRPARTTRP